MSQRIPFYLIDVFTDTPLSGNPAGVFFDEDGVLTDDEMRRCAAEMSRESAIVLPADPEKDGAAFRLRYFTSTTEVPLCGHATIAAAAALLHAGRAPKGEKIRFVNSVGLISVQAQANDTECCPVFVLNQRPKNRVKPIMAADVDEVAGALGCDIDAIESTRFPVQVYSTGTPWLYVPVRDRACVDAAPADFAAIARLSRRHGFFGIYMFTVERGENGKIAVWSRCFAPAAGLDEDPVTGSASACLGWYLHENGLLPLETTLTIEQGWAGGRGGTAHVLLHGSEDGALSYISVTGAATLVAEGAFFVQGRR